MSERILIIDDEVGIRETLSSILEDEGYETVAVETAKQAEAIIGKEHFDLTILDIWLPDRDGLETLQAIREHDSTAAVVMMSGHGTTSTAVKALKMGALDYLEKPLSYNQAVEAVNGGLRFRQSEESDGGLLTPADGSLSVNCTCERATWSYSSGSSVL